MEGKTKTFSRVAGFLNIVTAILLVIAIVMYLALLLSGNYSGESSSSSEETTEEQAGQAVAFIVSLLFFLPFSLILLIPLGVINVISGLVIGSHCLKRAPGRGTVIYSLILKILTLPAFGFAIILVAPLGAILVSQIAAVFGGYLVLFVIAHVFEWMAHRSALRD